MKLPRFLDPENPYEKDIEHRVCAFGKTLGTGNRKYKTPQNRGAPDRILFTADGRVYFIEFKSKGKSCTTNQIKEQDFIRGFGVPVFVCDNIEDGKGLLRIMC